jgi:hypothetical protein
MKNAIAGFLSLMILILAGLIISTVEGKTMRQNELDSTLSSVMEKSMNILVTKDSYTIDEQKAFVADFIQNAMVKMNSESDYMITVHSVDTVKGVLDVTVTENYKQALKVGKVSSRNVVVLDNFENGKNSYYLVKFVDGKTTIKQLSVYAGDSLAKELLPQSENYIGWKIDGDDTVYTADNADTINIISDITLNAVKK